MKKHTSSSIRFTVIGVLIMLTPMVHDVLRYDRIFFSSIKISIIVLGVVTTLIGITPSNYLSKIKIYFGDHPWMTNLLVVLMGLVVSLIVMEVTAKFIVDGRNKDKLSKEALAQQQEHNVMASPLPDAVMGYRIEPNAFGHDENGFRNDSVPETVDIVVLGDSHTWSVNVGRYDTWPFVLSALSNHSVYNMGISGWGPVQYWASLDDALELSPEVIIIGLYFGNDFYNAYSMVYQQKTYTEFRNSNIGDEIYDDSILSDSDEFIEQLSSFWNRPNRYSWLTRRSYLAQLLLVDSQWNKNSDWARAYPESGSIYDKGEIRTVFASRRFMPFLDMNDIRIVEGVRITENLINLIQQKTATNNVDLLFVLIPTKELVYNDLMEGSRNAIYDEIVSMESLIRDRIISELDKYDIAYVDLVPGLMDALTNNQQIYLHSVDGHPNEKGYEIYASAVLDKLLELDMLTTSGN